ncbi:MAG: EAL domain-containing protein [Proteobacteria bacterium]|uniref:putative bifunctional diguanylate cyclase/phosphodiesterase n=1 Tax=Aquabacterium sp. TaxID=1872578 RepID=UPI0035C76D0C|nr:EAL domain-containing protein [Pseudomonadota bacterium]
MSVAQPVPPDDEAARLSALQSYHVLDTQAEQAYDDLTTLAAQSLGVPISVVSLIDSDRQWFKSRVGLDAPQTPRSMAFCDHAIRGREVMVVPDARLDPRFADNPLVTGEPHIRFYAGAPLINPDGQALGTLCIIDRQPRSFSPQQCATLDVLARQVMAQLELRKRNAALSVALQSVQRHTHLLDNLSRHVPGVIYQYRLFPDGRSCFPYASQGLWGIYEVTPAQVREDASPVFERLHPQDVDAVSASIQASAVTLQPWHHEYRVLLPEQGERWRRGDAQPELLSDGSVLWHGFITDVTERKQAEEVTHRLAYFDALTGLPNRRLLIDRLEHALASMKRSGQKGALLFIDIDNFKHINDARGHAVGDVFLQQVAQRLAGLLRQDDTVARLGGDEFVVQVGNLGTDADQAARQARAVAEKVREVLESRYDIDGYPYNSSGSVGIAVFPRSDQRVDDLLREADTAMYRAKAGGRNRIAFFEPAMQTEIEERLAIERDMQDGIDAGQFELHIQPQVDASGQAVGGELLLRWTHPQRGSVPPSQFIPLAEESALILRLGDFVLQRGCEALAQLQQCGCTRGLSLNVSPRQFRQSDFVDRVRLALARSGARADGLILEVTEGLLIENWTDTVSRMEELVAMGVRFSIDDFGTGYSSLAYLKKLPLFELKIDRTFVRDTPGDPNDTAIVEAILSVSRHLGLRVVAEGVETREQADFLRSRGCDCLQGYHFGRPEPLRGWLARQRCMMP